MAPMTPIEIEYDSRFEDTIVTAIGRFTELGDAVDGRIERAELADLARRLSM